MSTSLLYDPDAAEEYETRSPRLERFIPDLSPQSETFSAPSPPPRRHSENGSGVTIDPGTVVLLQGLGPNNPELHSGVLLQSAPPDTIAMTDCTNGTEAADKRSIAHTPGRETCQDQTLRHSCPTAKPGLDATDLKDKATAGLEIQETEARRFDHAREQASETRHDPAQDKTPQLKPEHRHPHSGRDSPRLKLQLDQVVPKREDTIATSPNLSKHVITATTSTETLPALQPTSSIRDGLTSSPQSGKLPPIHQFIGHLDELAEVATQQDHRSAGHHHSLSYNSAASQSPMNPYHYASGSLTSPSSHFTYGNVRSPTSTISEHVYASPTQYSNAAYYADRRSSAPTERLTHPPSLPSASSSGDSHGTTGSSADGYSTSQTTPIDAADAHPRPMPPILPPPAGMLASAVVIAPGFKCDYPECTAMPFQTQYLLSSHKNVHSQSRPHYCPVKECPRSEGGRGFKRKNEMIRHGLVHDSPGYICPFCPDKEHRYPRPDNLQRHVRVHHVDKDRDDPQLRDVLAQRREGAGKARRRRANTAGSI